jgi:hypothetical protein
MATLTYGSARVVASNNRLPAAPARKRWFVRFRDALIEAQMRKAARDIERYRFLLPDQFEREAWGNGRVEKDELPFIR